MLFLYLLAPKFLKNTVLLLASLVFYAWGEPRYVVIMLISVALGYLFGLLIERFREKPISKLFLTFSVISSLSFLIYFKYADFFIENFNAATGLSVPLLKIALPVGISFYTFQILSYTVDVYRGEVDAQRNPINLAAYITLFPQLIAGPIVRYSDIARQLESREHTLEKTAHGIRRFIIGLGKKILIADALAGFCASFTETDEKSVLFFGCMPLRFPCRFISIFRVTAIWQSDSVKFSALNSLKISIIPLFRAVLPNFGEDGIFPWERGSVIMCISRSEETVFPDGEDFSISLSYGC